MVTFTERGALWFIALSLKLGVLQNNTKLLLLLKIIRMEK